MAERKWETRVFSQAAGQTSLAILIATLTDGTPPDSTLELRVAGRPIAVDRARWQDTTTRHGTLWLHKLEARDLRPGAPHSLELVSGTDVLASAIGTTLPADNAPRFALMVGSCFSIDSDWSYVVEPAYEQVASNLDVPTYNVWVGDQVYLDAPWQKGWTIANTHEVIYGKYQRSWGLTGASSGLAEVMARTSNWYLPDDHEFWNGYPAPSLLTLPLHTLRRVVLQAWRARPQGPVPHPYAQGKFGRVAGHAYCQFQTTRRDAEFSEGVSPPQLQQLDLPGATLVMADTRWHRTMVKGGDQAGFMLPDDFAHLIDILDTHEHLVCLALSRPLIGHLPHHGVTRGKVEYGPEDYTYQYERLWRAVTRRAERGVPTLSVAGDVHCHAVRGAIDGGLIEVVSSPMSLLGALDERSLISRARQTWKNIKGRIREFEASRRDEATVVAFDGVDDRLDYPDFREGPEWKRAVGTSEFIGTDGRSGIAGIEFDTSDPDRPAIIFRAAVANIAEPPEPERRSDPSLIEPTTIGFRWEDSLWVRQPACRERVAP